MSEDGKREDGGQESALTTRGVFVLNGMREMHLMLELQIINNIRLEQTAEGCGG